MKPNDGKALSVPVLYEKLVPGSGVEEICASVTVSAHLNCRFASSMYQNVSHVYVYVYMYSGYLSRSRNCGF